MLPPLVRFLLLLIVPSVLACSPSLTEDELVARATQALAVGDVAAAEVDVKTALQQNSNSAQARRVYGQIYMRQLNTEAAIAEFERSIAVLDTSETRMLLAKALVLSGNSAELLSDFDAGLYSQLANDVEFQAVLARAYLSQTQYEQARVALAEADALANDYIDITRAVFSWQLDQNLQEAQSTLQSVVDRSPGNAHAWSLLGILASQRNDNEAAEGYFANAAKLNPFRLSDRLRLVNSRIRLGRDDAADEELARLEKLIPNYPEVDFLRGQLYFNAGDYENALDVLAQVLTVEPDHTGALLLSASLNAKERNLATAQRQFTQFLGQKPGHVQASLQLADVWRLLGAPEKSETIAREILEEDEMNLSALSLLAVSLSAQGMHAESAEAYRQIAELQPESTAAQVALGSQQLVAGDEEAGIGQLEAALARDPDSQSARERLIEAHLAVGDLDAAARESERYVSFMPEDPRALIYHGRVRLQQEMYDDAKLLFEKALELEPGNVAASGGLAALAVANNDFESARASFVAALEANPGNLLTSMNFAKLLERTGDLEGMEEVLATAVEYNPDAVEPRLALARYALFQNEPSEAVSLLSALEEGGTDDHRVYQILAEAYLSAEQPNAAAASARRLLNLRENDPAVLALVARVESANGRAEVARGHLEKALTLSPGNTALRKLLIESLVAQKKLELALDEIAKLPAEVQEEAALIELRARIKLALGDTQEAEELFETAFQLQPNNINLVAWMGVRWLQGERQPVLAALEEWLKDHPDDTLTLNALASRLIEVGDEDGALRRYEELLALSPESVVVLNNLAWLSRSKDTQAALEYIKRADRLAPNSGQIKDTYSMVMLETGDTQTALALNSKALEDIPGDPDIRLNRAKIVAQAGDRDEAILILKELVAGPAFAGQLEARTILDSL